MFVIANMIQEISVIRFLFLYVSYKVHWSLRVPFVNTNECRRTETDHFHRCQIGYVFAVIYGK